jgi:hypothetical protein
VFMLVCMRPVMICQTSASARRANPRSSRRLNDLAQLLFLGRLPQSSSKGCRYAEYLTTTTVFTSLGVLRFPNDKCESLVERGLDRLPARPDDHVGVATIAYMNLALIALILIQVATGMRAEPYPTTPRTWSTNGATQSRSPARRTGPAPGRRVPHPGQEHPAR